LICTAATLKGPRPFGLPRKSPPGFVEGLDRIADTLFALLLPGARFWLQRGSWK
jgi:hypothetical protein